MLVAVLAALVARPAAQAPTQPPVFRSTVEVTSIDATVVDGDSRPITDLTPASSPCDVDGQPRHVVSAEWVSMLPDATRRAAAAAARGLQHRTKAAPPGA